MKVILRGYPYAIVGLTFHQNLLRLVSQPFPPQGSSARFPTVGGCKFQQMYRGFIAALPGEYRASARLGLAYRTSLKISRPLGSIRLYLLPRGRQSLAARYAQPKMCCPPLLYGFWHADCLLVGMGDEDYLLVLLQIVCLLMFSCGFVVLTQHPEWFGA